MICPGCGKDKDKQYFYYKHRYCKACYKEDVRRKQAYRNRTGYLKGRKSKEEIAEIKKKLNDPNYINSGLDWVVDVVTEKLIKE